VDPNIQEAVSINASPSIPEYFWMAYLIGMIERNASGMYGIKYLPCTPKISLCPTGVQVRYSMVMMDINPMINIPAIDSLWERCRSGFCRDLSATRQDAIIIPA
jgi:hypothetical protein